MLKYRYDMVRDVVFDICRHSGISTKKEAPVNYLTDSSDRKSTLRPTDVLVFGWVRGKHACVDLNGVYPLVRLLSGYHNDGSLAMLIVDLSNAFNLVNRSTLLQERQLQASSSCMVFCDRTVRFKKGCLDVRDYKGEWSRSSLGVKLLGEAVSRYAYFISGMAMRRTANTNEKLLKDLKKSELMVLGYKTDIAIKELRRKLEVAQKEKDGIQLTVDKLENASKGLNKLIECQIVDNCKKRLGYESYNAVPPPYIGNFIPPKLDLSYTGLDEFAVKPVVENKSSEEETKTIRKNTNAPIIEE
nr:auxilin-like protein [Tanacetum cinerariifolium]